MMQATLSDVWLWRPPIGAAWLVFAAALLASLAIRIHLVRAHRSAWPALAATALRLLTIGSLLVCALGPTTQPMPQASLLERPRLTVLADASGSMATADCGDHTRATHLARRWLDAPRRRALAERFDVRWLRFDRAVTGMEPGAEPVAAAPPVAGEATRLYEAIAQAITEWPADAGAGDVLVMSDGHDTTGDSIEQVVALAQARQVRVHTITFGRDTSPPRVLLQVQPPRRAMPIGTTGGIAVTLRPIGLAGTTLRLRHRPQNRAETTIDVPVLGRDLIDLWLPIRAEVAGQQKHVLTVDWPIAASSPEIGGSASETVIVPTTDRPWRVAMVEASPDWDSRFLADALRRDAGIWLTVLSAWRRDGVVGVRHAADSDDDRTDWESFDAIILAGDPTAVIDAAGADRLVAYVQRQGGVALWAGPTPAIARGPAQQAVLDRLQSIHPLVVGSDRHAGTSSAALRLTPTRRGRSLLGAGLARGEARAEVEFPAGADLGPAYVAKPAVVPLLVAELADGGTRPAVTAMPSGAGMCAAVPLRGLWRWRMSPPDQPDRGVVYDALWTNVIRYLAQHGDWEPGADSRIEIEHANLPLGAEQTIRVASRAARTDAAPRLTVRDPHGRTRPLALAADAGATGQWTGSLRPDAEGLWTARLEADSVKAAPARQFVVRDRSIERLDVAARPAVMTELSRRTGGVALRDEDADWWPDLLMTAARPGRATIAPTEWSPRWAHPLVLALLLISLIVEWALRSRIEWR